MFQMTVPYLVKRAAFKYPHKEAIVSEKGRWTYAQWEKNANKKAHALSKLGIRKGDHVATMFLNGNEVLEAYLALMKLGAVIVPLNVRFAAGELHYIVDHAEATSLMISREFVSPIRQIMSDLPKVEKCVLSAEEPVPEMIWLEEISREESDLDPAVEIEERDILCMLYTAGTTGKPKGVLLSHHNCLWSAAQIAQDCDLLPDYRVLLVFPLFHAAAFMILISNVFVGCTNVTMKAFDPRRVMEIVQEERINRMTFPPTVWNFILQLPALDTCDTSSVRSLSAGAEPVPLETKRGLLKLFPHAGLGESYGMTESTATITTLKPEDSLRKLASAGKPFTNVEIRLTDDSGREVAQGEVGEILARGPNVALGYFKDPQATAETFRDGWLHTGDLGRLDEEGFLYIVDRKKDMIISGGENIIPREIEELLYTHPKVLEAAVIGLPDREWGERVHAVVALKEGATMAESEVIDFCKAHIASFKKPKSVTFVERLPRSAAGKVLKQQLRERLKGGMA